MDSSKNFLIACSSKWSIKFCSACEKTRSFLCSSTLSDKIIFKQAHCSTCAMSGATSDANEPVGDDSATVLQVEPNRVLKQICIAGCKTRAAMEKFLKIGVLHTSVDFLFWKKGKCLFVRVYYDAPRSGARNEYVSQACAGSRCRTLPMAAAAASAIFQRMTSGYRAQKSAGGLPSLFAVRPVEWSTSSYNWK
jgi:hypothetical protein